MLRSLLIAAISSQALFAQSRPLSPDASTAGRSIRSASAFCIRGDRIGRCKSFAIVEIPIGAPLARSLPEPGGLGDAYVGLELGGMTNRDDSHAIGASVTGAVSAGASHVAINARARKWFSGKSYRDVSVGVLAMGSSAHLPAYGLTASASSAYSDLIGVWAGADVGLIGGPPRMSVHAGVHLGSYATLSVIGLAAALLTVGGGIHEGT